MLIPNGSDLGSPSLRSNYLGLSIISVLAIAALDAFVVRNFSLGFLYIFPIMLAALVLSRSSLLLLVAVCTILRELFAPFPSNLESLGRGFMGLVAFSGMGLFIQEISRNRHLALSTLRTVETEIQLRKRAESELKVLVDNIPLAILIVDWKGIVISANPAAFRVFKKLESALKGETADALLPVLKKFQRKGMPGPQFRTEMETKGYRANGEIFLARLWISTFKLGNEVHLSAMVADDTQDIRDREEAALRQLFWHSRLMMGAVAHEIRNLCAALGVIHANLSLLPGLAKNEDFMALGKLSEGLRAIALAELRIVKDGRLARVNLATALEDLRILIEPSFEEAASRIEWNVPDNLPDVWAESQGLTQVFLNICQNSQRAMQASPNKVLTVSAAKVDSEVILKFRDTGPGVSNPEELFKGLQKGAEVTGIGLYVSHAIVRGFGGTLQYEPQEQGACFAIELTQAKSELDL
jgi:two-component system, LuxR family, sensor kinase FixL